VEWSGVEAYYTIVSVYDNEIVCNNADNTITKAKLKCHDNDTWGKPDVIAYGCG